MEDLSIKILKCLQDDYINHKDFLDRPIRHDQPEFLLPKRVSVFDITLKAGASSPDVEKRLIELEGMGYITKIVSDKITPLPEINTLIELTDEGYKFIASHKSVAKRLLKKPKVEFSDDGKLTDINNHILIKKCSEKNRIYDTCKYLFLERESDKGSWIYWDEIDAYIFGMKGSHSRQQVYDQIKLINNSALKKINKKIVSSNGKEKYKVLY